MGERGVHILIIGRVQGVGFRAWVDAMAKRTRVRGWVRNRRSGGVEALFYGLNTAVQRMLTACYEGPDGSRVEEVTILGDVEVKDPGEGFSIRPTE